MQDMVPYIRPFLRVIVINFDFVQISVVAKDRQKVWKPSCMVSTMCQEVYYAVLETASEIFVHCGDRYEVL